MKGLKILIVLIGLFCLTGCGNKNLTCTLVDDSNGVKTTQTVKMSYKDDALTKTKMSIEVIAIDDEVKDTWNLIMGESVIDDINEDGLKITTENDNKKYRFNTTVDIDYTKASAELLEEYGFEPYDSKITYDEMKRLATEDGYTCK